METKLLDKKVIDILEQRILAEEMSSRLYQDMSLWFDNRGYANLAKLYKKYADEEFEHSNWAKEFLLSYDIKPVLPPLQSPEAEYTSCSEILDATLEHELLIAKECSALAKNALDLGEMTLHSLGMKYCHEQIEEINKATTLIDTYKLTNSDILFDHYVGENYLG